MSKYQLLPPLSAEEFQSLERSIIEHGVLVPVEYDEAGEIIDGHNRVKICESLGLVDWPRFVRKGLSEGDKRKLARELNLSRRHLSTAQKQAVIADQLRDTPSISSRAIAAMLGVDHKTVATVRRGLVDGGEIPHHDEVEGRDGVLQPARKPIKTAFVPDQPNVREYMRGAKVIRAEQQKLAHTVRLAHMDMVAEKGRAAAPAALALALAGLALGLLGRAAPSLQLLSLAVPVRATLGLVLVVLGLAGVAATFAAAWTVWPGGG